MQEDEAKAWVVDIALSTVVGAPLQYPRVVFTHEGPMPGG